MGDALSPAVLAGVVSHMPVVVAEAPSGRVVLGHAEMERLWRRTLPRAERVDDYGDWPAYHGDGRRFGAREWPLARTLATGEEVEAEEVEIERGDGTRGVICMRCTAVRDEQGRVVAALATCWDVTEQRSRDAGRRFLSEASVQLASSLDYEDTLANVARLAVPTLADWCSVDILREDGQIERLAAEHLDAEQGRRALEIARRSPPDLGGAAGVAQVIRTGEPLLLPEVTPEVIRTVARSEEHREFLEGAGIRSAMIVPLVARGRSLGAMVFITTLSSRRYGPAELELARDLALRAGMAIDNARLYHDAQAASRAKSDFLAVISHELRTPLTAVIGYAELLALGVPEPIPERQQEQVRRIEVSAHHLLQLIEEILTVVSLESGSLQLRREVVALADVLERAEVMIRPHAEARGLELHVADPGPDLLLETDSQRLLQVLANLLSNAVKFTERGEVRLDVEREEGRVRIDVRDTGIGLAPEMVDHIYDAFWQAEQPVTRRAGGTGLGLNLSRRLMELLGGEICVQSEPGQGSTFSVLIPLRPREPGA